MTKTNEENKISKVSLTKSVKNKDQYLRTSFLYQASLLLVRESQTRQDGSEQLANLSRICTSQMRAVARKSVLKLDPSIKRTVCKRCDTVLIYGHNCSVHVENMSKKKVLHADVLIHTCLVCGGQKRYPVGQDRNYITFNDRADVN
ncbi:RNAse P Rpr2/Rpp21/SNM1 subunit domain-containing protein [Lipomyces oligophaga]|uniref:RNAse P Rpr2/Rpp21/SNM1 subunit domain-containing protein n=1 Tax=Lipomyces oligophaga TaxID=45792 RepID=UPI0034CFF1F5